MPRRLCIAIVDDDAAVRRALQRVLRARSHEPIAFASGAEFLASLDDRQPDCVILDLRMPGMSGLDVQNHLRQRVGQPIPVIVVTAHPGAEIRQQCLAAGISAYLVKPLDVNGLMQAIADAVG